MQLPALANWRTFRMDRFARAIERADMSKRQANKGGPPPNWAVPFTKTVNAEDREWFDAEVEREGLKAKRLFQLMRMAYERSSPDIRRFADWLEKSQALERERTGRKD